MLGGKLGYTICCVVNALDLATLEVRQVLEHCDCTSIDILFEAELGPCKLEAGGSPRGS